MVVRWFVISEIRKDNSMIRARVVLTVFTLLLVSGGEALAAMSITNRDAYERTLQITEGRPSTGCAKRVAVSYLIMELNEALKATSRFIYSKAASLGHREPSP
jgi:hypothetical protein